MSEQSGEGAGTGAGGPTEPPKPPVYGGDQPAWPRVIGIISIAWGSIWVLCTGIGLGAGLFLLPMARQAMEDQGQEIPPSMHVGAGDYAFALAGVAMLVLLIVAGAATAARRAGGRTLHLVYAVLSLLMALPSGYFQIQKMQTMNQWVAEHPSAQAAQAHNEQVATIMVVLMFAIALSWPLFLIIWFGALGRRPEVGKRATI